MKPISAFFSILLIAVSGLAPRPAFSHPTPGDSYYRQALRAEHGETWVTYKNGQREASGSHWTLAFKLYKKAADLGNPRAMNRIGGLYEEWSRDSLAPVFENKGDGFEGKTGPEMSIYWWEKAAGGGNVNGMVHLARAYDKMGKQAQAVQWTRAAAGHGSVWAWGELADRFRDGKGTARDAAEAEKWAKLYRENYPVGQYNLGQSYEFGKGVTQDYVQARAWYQKAFQNRHWGPYENDDDYVYSFDDGIYDGEGQEAGYRIGLMCEKGEGGPADIPKAIAWFKRSTAWEGCREVGELYAKGTLVPRNYARALEWYKKAAFWSPDTRVEIAILYQNTLHDDISAYQWYLAADERGSDFEDKSLAGTAAKNREGLGKKLTPAQVQQAQEQDEDWWGQFDDE